MKQVFRSGGAHRQARLLLGSLSLLTVVGSLTVPLAAPASAAGPNPVFTSNPSPQGSVVYGGSQATDVVSIGNTGAPEGQKITITFTLPSNVSIKGGVGQYAYNYSGNNFVGTYTPPTPTNTIPTAGFSFTTTAAAGSTVNIPYTISSPDGTPASGTLSTTVTKATPFMNPNAAPNPVGHGNREMLTVSGSASFPADATGSVSFVNSTTGGRYCTAVLPAQSCSYSEYAAPGTTVPISAVYAGDSNYKANTATTSYTVEKATPGISVSTAKPSYVHGQTITFLDAGFKGDATGTLALTVAGSGDPLCSINVATDNSCTAPTPDVGRYNFNFSYNGDANYNGDNEFGNSFVVTAETTAVTGTVSNDTYGNPLTYSITGGLPSDATGTVTFTDHQGNLRCTVTLPATSCQDDGSLPAGANTITVAYSGDDAYRGSSSSFGFNYHQADVHITGFTSSGNFVHNGTPNTLTVTGLPANATGTLILTDQHNNVLCTATVAESACSPAKTLAVGDYQPNIYYSGDNNYKLFQVSNSTFPGSDFSVTQGTFTPTETASPLASSYGDRITFSAGAVPADATGSLLFTANTVGGANQRTDFCTATLPATSCTVDNLPAGTYGAPHVAYSGDANYSAADSGPGASVIVEQATTQVTVADVTGQADQPITVTVAGLPADATGQVAITDQYNDLLCTAAAPSGSCDISSSYVVGTDTLTASYYGDTNYTYSSTTFTRTVTKISVDLTASPDTADVAYGNSNILNAGGIPTGATGTVTFTDQNSKVLCSVSVDGGNRSCSVDPLPAGDYNVTATYDGDTLYYGGTATTSFTVDKVGTQVAITPRNSTTDAATPFTFYGEGLPPDATGTITFTDGDGGRVLCASVPVVNAYASCSASGFSPGSHDVFAVYSGDANYYGSTDDTYLTVTTTPTSATLTVTPNPAAYGTSVTATMDVTPTPNQGEIDFTDTSNGVRLCSVDLPLHTCTFTAGDNGGVGEHDISAQYYGVGIYDDTSAIAPLQVTRRVTHTMITANASTVASGTESTFTTSGVPASPDSATITYTDENNNTLCVEAVPADNGNTYTDPTTSGYDCDQYLSPGVHTITESYTGTSTDTSSTSSVTVTVGKTNAPFLIAATPAQVTYGTAVTLRDAVIAPGADPSGVTFTDQHGNVLCTSEGLDNSIGIFTQSSCVTSSTLAPGTYHVTATYPGDAQNNSAVATTTFTVLPLATTLTVTANPASHAVDKPFTLTGDVLPTDTTGTVIYTDEHGKVLCTQTLPAAHCTVAAGALSVGTRTITGTYSGDGIHAGSSATATVTVTRALTAVQGGAKKSPATYGAVTTAVASHLPKAATGTVTFTTKVAGKTLTCTVKLPALSCTLKGMLPAGAYTLTTKYSGDANYAPSSFTKTFMVTKAAVRVSAHANHASITVGGKVTVRMSGLPSSARGVITFRDENGRLLCTAKLPATGCSFSGKLGVGTHLLTARYSGDANHTAASQTFSLSVHRKVTSGGVRVPSEHTGEPFAGWLYYALLGLLGASGLGFLVRRRSVK